MGPQLSKPTIGKSHPANRASAELELEERNGGEALAVARTLLSDGTHVDRTGVLSTHTSSTTSWVHATYTCHHFKSHVRTAAMLHSTYFFHPFILLYVLLGYFHMLPFADMWGIEHPGRSACTTRSICQGTLHLRPHELHANPP